MVIEIKGNLLIKINRMLLPGVVTFLRVKAILWIKSFLVIIQQVGKVAEAFPKFL